MIKYIIIFLNFVILLSNFYGCYKEDQSLEINVHFTDSTYVGIKEIYKIGELIYVLASESFEAEIPDTVEIEIESGIGDYETIKASSKGAIPIPEIRDHGGYIQSNATDSITQKNGIIEVHPKGDTLWAIYTINIFIRVFDDAIIKP